MADKTKLELSWIRRKENQSKPGSPIMLENRITCRTAIIRIPQEWVDLLIGAERFDEAH